MKTLTKIEAERVLQIFNASEERLNLLSHVPGTNTLEYLDDLQSSSLMTSLRKLWDCEESLGKIETTSALFDSKDISLLRNTHKYTRNVCKNLSNSTNDKNIILEKPNYVSDEFHEFKNIFYELASQTFSKLNTTVEDEEINRNVLHELGDKTRLLEETKKILDSKILEMKFQKDRQLQDLDDAKSKLQKELKEISESNSIDCDLVKKEMIEAISKAKNDHEIRMKQLQETLKTLETSLFELTEKNREEELRCRKEKNKAENALNQKIIEYNENMELRSNELQFIEENLEIEKQEYEILKEYFDRVDEEIAKKLHEDNILKAVVDREKFGFDALHRAATKIQKIARGRISRKSSAKMFKKAKKGKKGAKGKVAKKK